MTSNLATQLREGTSKSHTMAENVNFIKSFLGGVIDKSSYVEMLSKLYFVYEAIEKAMEENKEHEYIKPIYFPELNRTQSLKEDLDFHFSSWRRAKRGYRPRKKYSKKKSRPLAEPGHRPRKKVTRQKVARRSPTNFFRDHRSNQERTNERTIDRTDERTNGPRK